MTNRMPNTTEEIPFLDQTKKEILKEITEVAKMMDSAFRIPVIGKSFGADAIIGFFPGFGDFITALPALYIVLRAKAMGLPNDKIVSMISNIVLDTGVGLVPLVGDLLDFFWKANIKNINIIHSHFQLPPYKASRNKQQQFIHTRQEQYSSSLSESDFTRSPSKQHIYNNVMCFEEWLNQTPALKYFTEDEQQEAYQNYISSAKNNP